MNDSISRRTFVGSVFAGATAMALGLTAPYRAFATEAVADTTEDVEVDGTTYSLRTYSADVVVIGSGVSGLMAAKNALEKGASVILVDKGPFGRSGASGINWGHELMSYEGTVSEYLSNLMAPMIAGPLCDQEYYSAIVHASNEMQALQQAVKAGTIVEATAVSEDSAHNLTYPFLRTMEPIMPRFFAQEIRRSDVQIIDRTMMLDILQGDDGSVSGIVGLDLVEGQGVLVQAKSVVMCTGSPCWANGWSGVGAKSNASPENTGDGLALLLGHGVPIKNIEQWDLYFYNAHQSGIAFSQGIGVSVGVHPENMLISEGERFLVDNPSFGGSDRGQYEMLCMKEVYEGRGSENGGLWYDASQLEEPDYVMAFNRRVPENHRRALRFDDGDTVEIVPTPWECGGAPHLDNTGQTAIEGLYYASANDQAYGGSCATICFAGGWLAGGSAAEYAAGKEQSEVNTDAVQEIVASAFATLNQAPENPVRALDVMHTIQNIMNQYCWLGRTETTLNQAIQELETVRDTLMPRMYVPDKSTHFNQEWRQALEVPFMWTNVMATAQAALARTESRGSHHRLDYPATDNKSWLKNVYVQVDAEGNWSTEAKDIVTKTLAIPLVSMMAADASLL